MAQLFKVEKVQPAGKVQTKKGLVPKYTMTLSDEYGVYEDVSILGDPPQEGSVISGHIENVERLGFVYHNFVREPAVEGVKIVSVPSPKTESKPAYDRAKFDFTKEEKIQNDERQAERILRQGFMNQVIPMYKGNLDKWLEDVKRLEPVYRKYVTEGVIINSIDKEETEKEKKGE